MTLLNLFKKDYNRIIETVIKADDTEHLKQEVDEYVITNEIKSKLADFFEAYNVPRQAVRVNGVWISGFYGSGKSHLLKMLSYILENKENVGEIFANKIEDDPKLKGDISRALRNYDAESILFNIDQQAERTSKESDSAILQVFYKVFYDHLGYYGAEPHVADFEMYLDKQTKYEAFKELFLQNYNKPWEEVRNRYFVPKVKEAVAQACASLFGAASADYDDFIKSFKDSYKQSIALFADLVKEYLNSKGDKSQLNFFVDEVGQFIAEDKALMLNLQTIAESLLTKCGGRSWVFVTSQETLEHHVANIAALEKDDFSKIQGRFKIKIPLTSANIDEVIERRLLDKTEEGTNYLKDIYQIEHNNLKTLLSITGKGKHQDNFYTSDLDFSNKYPFVPYQFNLFQECLKKLSEHNVFQGRSQSVGERSMLGVFQDVLKKLPKEEQNPTPLVGFDFLFEGLRGTLRTEAQNAIIQAEGLLKNNPMAIRIMKLLFLLKYNGDDVLTTAENIGTLLIDSYTININDHQKQVQVALNTLEDQTYIQRKGEVYEYLTNEEKDIEEEIKNTPVEERELNQQLNELIYDHILKGSKIYLSDYQRDFFYTRVINNSTFGRTYELSIEFSNEGSESYFYAGTVDVPMMRVKLPTDNRLMQEMRISIQTKSYYSREQTKTMKDSRRDILAKKIKYNHVRENKLKEMIERVVIDSDYYINGSVHAKSSSSDAKVVISEAFQELVETVYTKLHLVVDFDFSEQRLKTILSPDHQTSIFDNIETNSKFTQASNEILTYLTRQENLSKRVNLAEIKDYFGSRPYGWELMEVWCLLAMLSKKGKIEAKKVTNTLDDQEFLEGLLNNRSYQEVRITLQEEFDLSVLNAFKRFHAELFNETNSASEAKEIVRLFQSKGQALLTQVRSYIDMQDQYPFYGELTEFEENLEKLLHLEYGDLLKNYTQYNDDLLDDKELFDEFKMFSNGPQKEIYKKIKTLLSQGAVNLEYIKNKRIEDLRTLVTDSTSKVLGQLNNASDWIREIEKQIIDELHQERENRLEQYKEILHSIESVDLFQSLPQAEQVRVLSQLEEKKTEIDNCKFISRLKDYDEELKQMHIDLINHISDRYEYYNRPPESDKKEVKYTDTSAHSPVAAEPVESYRPIKKAVRLEKILSQVNVEHNSLETKEDVELYLSKMRKALEHEIKNNKVIYLK